MIEPIILIAVIVLPTLCVLVGIFLLTRYESPEAAIAVLPTSPPMPFATPVLIFPAEEARTRFPRAELIFLRAENQVPRVEKLKPADEYLAVAEIDGVWDVTPWENNLQALEAAARHLGCPEEDLLRRFQIVLLLGEKLTGIVASCPRIQRPQSDTPALH